MERDVRWARMRDLLGREPTRIEEELAIHLIRTGHLHTVEQIILGRRVPPCPIGALTPVADLILEKWNGMEPTHQEGIRLELRTLLWRIGGAQAAGPAPRQVRELGEVLRGIELASRLWRQLDREQRREVRQALQRFRIAAER